jgi:hypothetical protein
LEKQDCELERLTLINRLAIIRQHPQSFGHIKTGEQGYYVVISGEVAHMMRCQPVDVIARITASCSSNMPVWYGNTSMYMEPVARILTNTSSEIPCSSLTPSLYEIDNKWYQFSPKPVLAHTPQILSPNHDMPDLEYQNLERMMRSGLYGQDTIDNFKSFISFPMIRLDASSYLSAKVSGVQIYKDTVYKGDWLITPLGLEQRLNEYFGRMFVFLKVFGSYAGALWGAFVIYKVLAKLVSVVVNALSIHKIYGCGLHMFAALLDAFTHLIFVHKKVPQRDTESSTEMNESQKTWKRIRAEEGWDEPVGKPSCPPIGMV